MRNGVRTSLACWLLAAVSCSEPPPSAASEPGSEVTAGPHVLYLRGGRALTADDARVWLGDRPAQAGATLGITLDGSADDMVLRTQRGRYLAQQGGRVGLSEHPADAIRWRVLREAGPGEVAIGEAFTLRSSDGRFARAAAEGGALELGAQPDTFSLGCYFEPGPHAQRWQDAVSFGIAAEHTAQVSRAVAWLQARTLRLQLPFGDLPLVVWNDPTLEPQPAVAYLMTDSLWTAKALGPYDPDLADALGDALLSLGWYGNGLADTLFHAVGEPAHAPTSSDAVHGTALGSCALAAGAGSAQLRVPEVAVDPGWTAGNSAQFIDSAVYTALADFHVGKHVQALARLRDAIEDTGGADAMFWDAERRVLIDQASRCDYDAATQRASQACPVRTACAADSCEIHVASLKLGLLLYAARVTGLEREPGPAQVLSSMRSRLWEGQLESGGIPHALHYAPDGRFLGASDATGEATALAVLAFSLD